MTRAILAWCLYDLANTIFAINMTSYHFPVWVVADRGGTELAYGLGFGLSMLASAAVMPWLGRVSDRTGRRAPWLIVSTVACVLLTASIGWVSSLTSALLLFALANFCYQIAGLFYSALMPVVVPPDRMGRVSGYGVALGYVGTLLGILATASIAARWGRQATFLPTGVLFLILSLPAFLWVRDGPVPAQNNAGKPDVIGSLRPLLSSAWWGLSVIGITVVFMAVYAKQAVGLSDPDLQRTLVLATTVTVAGTTLWGRVTERIGGFRALGWVWAVWAAAFGLASLGFDPVVFTVVSCIAGVALGGTWVSSRVLLLEWVGPQAAGEVFGLFGLISRLSGVAGPILWGIFLSISAPLGRERYRLGMGLLFAATLTGAWLYSRVRPPRQSLLVE